MVLTLACLPEKIAISCILVFQECPTPPKGS